MTRPTEKAVQIEMDSPLEAYYTFDEAEHPRSDSANLQVHGLAHGSIHFANLASAMNRNEGISTARLDIYSNGKNWVGLDHYARVIPEAILQIRERMGIRIGSITAHSMGGEETQEAMQQYPEIMMPAAYLAPIPTGGALKGAMKIDKRLLLRTLPRLEIREVMRTPEQIKKLFFQENVNEQTEKAIGEMPGQLEHTSYWAYTQLLFRPLLRPRIVDTGMPTMLIRSETDFLFDGKSYEGTRKTFSRLREEVLPGGHDFFIENADAAARLIGAFHREHA